MAADAAELARQRLQDRQVAALLLPKMKKIPVFHRKRKVDWLGGVLLMASAVVFMLVLTWGGTRLSWLSPTITAMIGTSIALAGGFVWHARRADEPFLPLSLLALFLLLLYLYQVEDAAAPKLTALLG